MRSKLMPVSSSALDILGGNFIRGMATLLGLSDRS
jgi:hypothetical protein